MGGSPHSRFRGRMQEYTEPELFLEVSRDLDTCVIRSLLLLPHHSAIEIDRI